MAGWRPTPQRLPRLRTQPRLPRARLACAHACSHAQGHHRHRPAGKRRGAARFPRPWRAAYLTGTRRTAALSACPAALRSRVWLQQRGRAGTERVLGGRVWGRCVCGSPSREGEKRPGASGSVWRGWVIVCAVPCGWPGSCAASERPVSGSVRASASDSGAVA